MSFFSIIIPVYNVAPYLCECLDSVLAQTFTDWEAICVDDGSTDESGDILDKYAKKDSRFRIIHQSNAGVSAARNSALDASRGEWITFLDADDKWQSNLLEVIKANVEANCEIIRFRFANWDGGSNSFPVAYSTAGVATIYDRIWGYKQFLRQGWIWICAVQKNAIEGIRFPVGMRYQEDTIFRLSIMAKVHAIVQIDWQGYLYRQCPTSVSHSRKCATDFVSFFNELARIIDRMPTDVLNSVIRDETSRLISDNIIEWIQEGIRLSREDDDNIYSLIKIFSGRNIWRVTSLQVRWRAGAWIMLHFKSFAFLRFTSLLLGMLSRMRRG